MTIFSIMISNRINQIKTFRFKRYAIYLNLIVVGQLFRSALNTMSQSVLGIILENTAIEEKPFERMLVENNMNIFWSHSGLKCYFSHHWGTQKLLLIRRNPVIYVNVL